MKEPDRRNMGPGFLVPDKTPSLSTEKSLAASPRPLICYLI